MLSRYNIKRTFNIFRHLLTKCFGEEIFKSRPLYFYKFKVIFLHTLMSIICRSNQNPNSKTLLQNYEGLVVIAWDKQLWWNSFLMKPSVSYTLSGQVWFIFGTLNLPFYGSSIVGITSDNTYNLLQSEKMRNAMFSFI